MLQFCILVHGNILQDKEPFKNQVQIVKMIHDSFCNERLLFYLLSMVCCSMFLTNDHIDVCFDRPTVLHQLTRSRAQFVPVPCKCRIRSLFTDGNGETHKG